MSKLMFDMDTFLKESDLVEGCICITKNVNVLLYLGKQHDNQYVFIPALQLI